MDFIIVGWSWSVTPGPPPQSCLNLNLPPVCILWASSYAPIRIPRAEPGIHTSIHSPSSHLQLVGHPPCPPPGRKVTSRATHDHAPTTRYNRPCNPELHPLLPSTLRCEVKEKSRTLFHPSSILLEISTNDLCRRGMSFLLSPFVAKSTFFPPFSSTT